nr:RNA-directed DNA polymerase, eukaryota [Tanacetum cinerariifolium]
MARKDVRLDHAATLRLTLFITLVTRNKTIDLLKPILLRDVQVDFGPTLFRFYHSWFCYEGFDEMVEQSWRAFSHSDRNAIIRFKKKLQDLKIIIRQWIKVKRDQLSRACENGPYLGGAAPRRRMIPEPGDANREVNVTETFHLQTDDELSEKELKKIEADDQAIQTIILGLPEDIYAAVDSCETDQEIWLRVQQMMKGSDIGIQEKKAKISSYPKNMQIAQPGMSMGQDKQMQMVGGNGGNQFRQYEGQNAGNPAWYNNVIRNQKEEAGIQLQAEEYDLMAAIADLDEIEEVNANCILMENLQQASTSGTQT